MHVTHKQVLECVDTLVARLVTQNIIPYQPHTYKQLLLVHDFIII